MENNNIENNIKDAFDQYTPQLDHDEIWENIEPKLKRKKKRRFFFFWLFGGLAVLGLLFVNLFRNSHDRVADTTIDSPIENSVSIPEIDQSIAVIEDDSEREIIQKESKTNKKSATSASRKARSNNIMTPVWSAARTTVVSKKAILSKTESGVHPSRMVGRKPLENSTKTIIESSQRETEASETPDLSASNLSKEMTPVEVAITKEDLPDGKIPIAEKSKTKQTKKKRKKRRKIIKPLRNKLKYYIQPTISATVPLKIFGSNTSSSESSYRNTRRNTERQLEAFSFGLNVQAQTRNGFVITTGIEIQRLNGRFDYEETTLEIENYVGVISTTENALGETISTVMGPKTRTITRTKTQRFFNHHTFINFPVGIGKIWSQKKYDFRFISGVDINLYHNYIGRIAGPNGDDLDMRRSRSKTFDQTFKRNTGLGLWATGEFHKLINNQFTLSFAPKIQLPLSKITQDDYVLSQRFVNLSLTVGANFLINPVKKKKK